MIGPVIDLKSRCNISPINVLGAISFMILTGWHAHDYFIIKEMTYSKKNDFFTKNNAQVNMT